jgi:transposase-like protein
LAVGAAYAPELNKRCRPYLKPVNKSYRIDETYIKVKGDYKYLCELRDVLIRQKLSFEFVNAFHDRQTPLRPLLTPTH